LSELSVRELPLFPLPEVVLFPQEYLPLHIFETRYRLMLQSVLKSDSRFGVVRWDPIAKKMADVGCCAEVIKHQTSQDGRSNIVTIGQYLSPSPNLLPVQRFVSPSKFNFFKVFGEKDLDFMQVVSSPLTRSSYHAEEIQKLMKKYPR